MASSSRVTPQRTVLAAILVFALLSLARWAPVERVEQAPAVLLRPFEEVADSALRSPSAGEQQALGALVSDARLAWEGWQHAIEQDGPPPPRGTQTIAATVLGRDLARRELRALVPAGAVRVGAPACHHGALVGFVVDLQPGPETATELAVVGTLGRHDLRAVAGRWQASPQSVPVEVLVGADQGTDARHPALALLARSSTVPPPPGQLCHTRDVSALGDTLPAGLLLGRLDVPQDDRPGGAARARLGEGLVLHPLIDPFALDLLSLAGAPSAPRTPRRLGARLLATSGSSGRRRLDHGARDGVRVGDWVSQAGLYVGVVVSVAGGTAIADTTPPSGPLLCVTREGEVRTLGLDAASWPSGWQPSRGDLLALGRPGTGGLLLGLVAGIDDDGVRLERPAPDLAAGVTVTGP
jgi:hypothetical protein